MSELIIEPCEFWCVWTKTGRPPHFAHHTEESAVTEADRLAAKHPGKKFIVMRAYRKGHIPLPTSSSSAEGAATP